MGGFHGTIDIEGFSLETVLDFLDFCGDIYQAYGLEVFCTEFTRDEKGSLLWYRPTDEDSTDEAMGDWELASLDRNMAERYPLLNVNVEGHAAVFEYANPHIARAVVSYVRGMPSEVDRQRFLEQVAGQVLCLNGFLLASLSHVAGMFGMQPVEAWVTWDQKDEVQRSGLPPAAISAFRDLCEIPKSLQSGVPTCSQVFILIDNVIERFLKSVMKLPASKRLSFPSLLQQAHKAQLISREQLEVAKRLHRTRNRIQHEKDYRVSLQETRTAFYIVLGVTQSVSHWIRT